MKRDIDLIRKILEAVETLPHSFGKNLEIEGYDLQAVAFHMELLEEAGYLIGNIDKASNGEYANAWPTRLTWEGYEFLELARNDTTWDKSKKFLKDKSLSVPVTILTELLKSFVKEALGLSR